VCDLKRCCSPMIIYANTPYQVEAEQDQIHDVIPGKMSVIQVSVNEPKSSQSSPSLAALRQVGDEHGFRLSNENHFDAAVAAQQQSKLTAGFEGKAGEISGQIRRNNLLRGYFTPFEILDPLAGNAF